MRVLASDSSEASVLRRRDREHTDSRNALSGLRAPGAAIAAVTILGCVVRVAPVVGRDFALLDGGLFTVMIEELSRTWWLPATTSYNGMDVPFAYPPLGLYIGAALKAVGLDTLWLVQWLPVLLSVATVPALYLFVSRLTRSPVIAAAAAFAFAVAPRAYEWMIAGGGITRALGLLLALLTLAELVRRRAPSPWGGLALGVLAGLTVLAHPEAAAFGLAVGVLLLVCHRSTLGLPGVGVAAIVGVAIVTPWLFAVIGHHGLGPLVAGASSRTDWYGVAAGWLFSLDFTGLPIVDPISIVATVGLVTTLLRRQWLPAAMLLVTYLAVPSSLRTFAMIPWAILFGVSIRDDVLPLLHERARLVTATIGAAVAVVASLWSAYPPASPLAGLRPDDRAALSWVDEHLEDGTQIVVVTPAHWSLDYIAEWLPALTGARSMATVQGNEWLGAEAWNAAVRAHDGIQACHLRGAACLDEWLSIYAPEAAYAYVPKTPQRNFWAIDCCVDMRRSLDEADAYHAVYDGPGATIYRIENSRSRGESEATRTAAAPGQMAGMATKTPIGTVQRRSVTAPHATTRAPIATLSQIGTTSDRMSVGRPTLPSMLSSQSLHASGKVAKETSAMMAVAPTAQAS